MDMKGELHEGLVTIVEGETFLQVGPQAFLQCGALVMQLWKGKRVRITVDVLDETEAAEAAMKEAA